MAKLVMDRRAADNKYLHRDFHVSGDRGLAYVGKHWGDAGVKEYLERFTVSWYSPLIADIGSKGLEALRDYIQKIYDAEEASGVLHITFSENELMVNVDRCPGISYMHSIGYEPSPWYRELTSTVNRVIAEKSGINFELQSYDEKTGKTAYRFFINTSAPLREENQKNNKKKGGN